MLRASSPRASSFLPLALVLLAAPARAADKPAAQPAGEDEGDREFKSIQWTQGPATVHIGEQADIKVPEGYAYTGAAGSQKLLRLMHNPTSGSELGILTDDKLSWFLLFEFEDIGYVKDADKEQLDADEMLSSIREGTEASNKEREKEGWPPITIVGWHTKPFYNKETNNLEWCIEGESRGHKIINYNTRLLGRRGVMSANLMVRPDGLDETLPVTKKILAGYTFSPGKRYGEWRSGDKIAKYGLSALVVGGAVGVAAKMGLLGKLGILLAKLWKAVAVAFLALVGAIKRLFTGRRREEPPAPPPGMQPPPQQG